MVVTIHPIIVVSLEVYNCGFTVSRQALGGPWRMSPLRPKCLRPMLSKEEYKIFADQINLLVSWNVFSWEMLWFYCFSTLVPPLSALAMVCCTILRTINPKHLSNIYFLGQFTIQKDFSIAQFCCKL